MNLAPAWFYDALLISLGGSCDRCIRRATFRLFSPNDIKKPVIIGLFCGFVLFKKMNHRTVYDLNMRDPLFCFCFKHDL